MRFLLIMIICALGAPEARAQEKSLHAQEKSREGDFPYLVEKLKETVVSVRVVLLQEFVVAEGMGFFIDHSGIVMVPRKLVEALAEEGTELAVETYNGEKMKNPQLLGCESPERVSCFLQTNISPQRWFALDEPVGISSGIKVFSLSINSKRETKLGEFESASGKKLRLNQQAAEDFWGAPVFTIRGDLLGILSNSKRQDIEVAGDQLQTALLLGWKEAHAFKRARIAKLRRKGVVLSRKVKSADWKIFSLSKNSGQVNFALPKQLVDKKCRKLSDGPASRLNCKSSLFKVEVSIVPRRDSVRFLEGNPSSEPLALDMVRRQMRATPSYWVEREKHFPKEIREKLFSQPGLWSCRQVKGGRRCVSVETQFHSLEQNRSRVIIESNDSELAVEVAVSGDAQLQSGLNQLLLGIAERVAWRKASKSSRSPASVMTSAGRLARARDFCYVDRKFCRLKIR